MIGTPGVLFEGDFTDTTGGFWANYDVAHNGQRFLIVERDATADVARVNVVLHALPNRNR